MTEERFRTYRRRIPHWRLEGGAYFVTWRLKAQQPDLSQEERNVVVSALKYFDGDRYDLKVFVVMNDHVHALVIPQADNRLESIVHSWKSYSARTFQVKFGRIQKIWQEEYFDRIMRDTDEFLEKANYILNNPWKRWPDLTEYQWVECQY